MLLRTFKRPSSSSSERRWTVPRCVQSDLRAQILCSLNLYAYWSAFVRLSFGSYHLACHPSNGWYLSSADVPWEILGGTHWGKSRQNGPENWASPNPWFTNVGYIYIYVLILIDFCIYIYVHSICLCYLFMFPCRTYLALFADTPKHGKTCPSQLLQRQSQRSFTSCCWSTWGS